MPDALSVRFRIERGAAQSPAFDVAFDAPPGVTLLFGPSGAGKSPTLAAIAGLVRPTEGRIALGEEVWFDSRDHVERPVEERALAFVFQSLALFPHMTALDNVEYAVDRRLRPSDRRDRARKMLERMH